MKTALDFDTIIENAAKMWKKQQRIRLFINNKPLLRHSPLKGGEDYDGNIG